VAAARGKDGSHGVMDEFWRKVREWEGEGKRFLLLVFDEADHLFIAHASPQTEFLAP